MNWFFDHFVGPGLDWIETHYEGWRFETVSLLWVLLMAGLGLALPVIFGVIFIATLFEAPIIIGLLIGAALVYTLRPNRGDPPPRKEWK